MKLKPQTLWTSKKLFRFLEGSALFAGTTPEQHRAVAAAAIEKHPAGSIVIEEDAPSDYFYLIVEGKVDIDRKEKHLILESLSTGAVFGLLSIIEHKPRSATVEIREPSILINSISTTSPVRFLAERTSTIQSSSITLTIWRRPFDRPIRLRSIR